MVQLFTEGWGDFRMICYLATEASLFEAWHLREQREGAELEDAASLPPG